MTPTQLITELRELIMRCPEAAHQAQVIVDPRLGLIVRMSEEKK